MGVSINQQYQNQFNILKSAFLQNRLSHAYLLSGISGLGKTLFAQEFARFLLCEKNHEKNIVCGKCRACQLMRANNHPDFLLCQPEEKWHSIKIDQIRLISEKLAQTAHAGGYQIVVIAPADAMPVQAANALLKTLEEPVGKVVIFLIDDQKSMLPETIVSRCQKIFFSSAHIDLRLYDHSLQLRDQLLDHLEKIMLCKINSISLNPAWLKMNLDAILQQLILMCGDLSKIQLGANQNLMANYDQYERLINIANQITSEKLQEWIDMIFEKKRFVSQGVNLNQQLCLEDVFIEYERSHSHSHSHSHG